MSPGPDRAPAWRRWQGIRAQLLLLLLPGMALMLALDSWSDYQYRAKMLDSAYDEALLEPLSVLDDNVRIDARGEVDLAVPFAVQAMFASVPALHKHLHVGLTPLDAGAPAGERTLMGVADLPPPPADAQPVAPPASFGAARDSRIVFYTASYRGYPVRVASLQRDLQDAAGRRWRLRVEAAESTGRRVDARADSLQRELRQDVSMLLVTALLVWFGIAWALRPLKRLRASLRERPARDLQPLDAGGVPYEVAPLVDAVNHHIADHRQVLGEQSRFLADASHQLRTPLAIMMTQAGYAMREHDPALLRETLQAITAQLARSQRLTDQLLTMAHASRAGDDAATAPIADLNAVAREVVLQYLPLAHAKNQDLGWDDIRGEDAPEGAGVDAPAAPVRAQPAELHEALANLVHNAIHHTPAHGSITVAVRIEGDTAFAQVSDSGPGIAPERREAAFERFQRGAPQTPGAPSGAGLGLAIARAYARRNGGDIVLADATHAGGTGLRARLVLPLAR
jgi:two-component system sensor histidine kinase TctE